MSQYSSLTKTEALFVKENGRLLKIYYESIMNYHGGAMPAGVALAFRLFSGLTERYQAIVDGFPERDSVYFYTGLGENGQGIIDTAEALYRVRSRRHLGVDINACTGKDAPDAPGGGKYYFSGKLGNMSWEAAVRNGIIGEDFFSLSKKMHMLQDQGKLPMKEEISQLMETRKRTEQQILKLTPDELFLITASAK